MAQSEQSLQVSQKRHRISWTSLEVQKTFLEACVVEVATYGHEGGSLKPSSWKTVAERLKVEHNFIVDRKQMKNRHDYLKSKFGAWLKLKNKTGNIYNPITNTFNMEDEEWEREIKSNKFVEHLRSSPLAFANLCVQLFDGATSTGVDGWGPSSKLPRTTEGMPVINLGDIDEVNVTQMESMTLPESPNEGSSRPCKNKAVNQKGKGKENEKEKTAAKLIEVGDEIGKVSRMQVEKHQQHDIGACMAKLEDMRWEIKDPRYQTALMILVKPTISRKFGCVSRRNLVSCGSQMRERNLVFFDVVVLCLCGVLTFIWSFGGLGF